jgi:lysophospholipid acyltransferase (LPLAT)-like uncharacterized protein
MPFSKCVMTFGEPVQVPPDATDEGVEEIRLRLQDAMTQLEMEAERILGYRAGA